MKYRKRLYLSIISLITFFAMNANVNRPLEDFFQYGPLDHTNREAKIISHKYYEPACIKYPDMKFPTSIRDKFNGAYYRIIGFGRDDVFKGCPNILTVEIPQTYKKIPSQTFIDCQNLSKFIPEGISTHPDKSGKNFYINDGILYQHDITNVIYCYPAGRTDTEFQIPAKCTGIGEYAFYKNHHLNKFIIHDNVLTLGTSAFEGCDNITSVTIPGSIKTIGSAAFFNCNSLNEVRIVDLSGWCQSEFATPLANPAYLSKKLNYMGDVVADLVIPTTAVNIGKNAFYGYTPLKSVTFHDNVSSVSTDAFANCDNLAEVNISDLASWCNIDFMSETSNPLTCTKTLSLNNTQIDILNIPEGVNKIKKYTFVNGNFTQIWIPSSVDEIADAAFKDTHPHAVRSYGVTPPSIINTAFSDYTATLFVPKEARVSYWSHNVWGLFANINDMPVDAVSISLDKSEYELYVYDTFNLNVTFNPVETTDKNLTWSSSDECVATVDAGVVRALKQGNAIITATTTNNKSASCLLTIKEVLANSIEINPDKLTLVQGATTQLFAQFSPVNTTNQSIKWSSEDEGIVAISQEGIVNALSEGSTQITAQTQDGTNLSAKCFITVKPVEPTAITLSENEIDIQVGKSLTLVANVQPENSKNKEIFWTSSNPNVASVDNNGKIVGLAIGKTIITATTYNGLTANCEVRVNPALVESISLSPEFISEEERNNVQITATVLPEHAANKSLAWSSSDEGVATVDNNGSISLIKKGKAVITASATDNSGISATCDVTVYASERLVSSISLTPSYVDGREGEELQLYATVLPEDATNKTLAWSSSDEGVAAVNATGLISLLKKGTAIITASATDTSGISAECAVVVTGLSGIDDVLTDKSAYIKVFNLNGTLIYEGVYADANLMPDYYIVICDGKNIKVKVK